MAIPNVVCIQFDTHPDDHEAEGWVHDSPGYSAADTDLYERYSGSDSEDK